MNSVNSGLNIEASASQEQNPVNKPPRGPGYDLYQGREAAHLTVEQVAEHLRLPFYTIKAIEEDDYQGFKTHAFVRGYIRAYAKLLKLPAEPLIAKFNQLGLIDQYSENPNLDWYKHAYPSKKRWFWSGVALVLCLFTLLAIVVWKLWPLSESPSDSIVQQAPVEETQDVVLIPLSTTNQVTVTPLPLEQ